MYRRLKWIFVLLIATSLYSTETITLQNGSNGYDGCEDVSIFKDSAVSEFYSFIKTTKKASPTDSILINAEFCC